MFAKLVLSGQNYTGQVCCVEVVQQHHEVPNLIAPLSGREEAVVVEGRAVNFDTLW